MVDSRLEAFIPPQDTLAPILKTTAWTTFFRSPNQIDKVVTKVLPIIGQIKEVHSDDEKIIAECERLFNSVFKEDEAEDLQLTASRRRDMDLLYGYLSSSPSTSLAALRDQYGDSRFFHLAITDPSDHVIAQSQFSVTPVGQDGIAVYLQYIIVVDAPTLSLLYPAVYSHSPLELRNRGLATLFYALQFTLAQAHGKRLNRTRLIGTFCESEMKGQASDPVQIKFTYNRLIAHSRSGAKIMMLVRKADGRLWTPHCQPRLSAGQRRIILHLLVNFAPSTLRHTSDTVRRNEELNTEEEELLQASRIVDAYLDNFLYENFDAKEVEDVRRFVRKRFEQSKSVVYLDAEQLPSMCELAEVDSDLKLQIEETLGSLERHQALVAQALGR